jgi:hypothetical protein
MSDNETTKVKAGSWTDKERVRPTHLHHTHRLIHPQLTYLFALIESSNVKFDYAVRSSIP